MTNVIEELHREIFGEPEPQKNGSKPPVSVTPVDLDDAELLEKARSASNGDKFERLERGDWSEYPSQSEADLAYTSLLAFWTGNDAARMDRLFKASGLMRDKWKEQRYADGRTYGEATIEKAIADNEETYDGGEEYEFHRSGAKGFDTGEPVDDAEDELAPAEDAELATWEDIGQLVGRVHWEWSDWLAAAMLHLLAGEPGDGKSFLMLRIAACYLLGWEWPDGTKFQGEIGKILWAESEAGQALNWQRAKAMGLPTDQIISHDVDALLNLRLGDKHHREELWRRAIRPDVRLIVVDSLSASHNLDENSSRVLDVVGFLATLARDTSKPVLLSHHLRKRGMYDSDGPSLQRLRGSTAITQPARVIWAIDRPNVLKKDNLRLSVIKSNLGRFPEPLGMWIDESGVNFGDAPARPKVKTVAEKAEELLVDLLADGPVASKEVEEAFDNAGISMGTAKKAKKALGIVSTQKEDGWYWRFPDDDDA